MFRAVIEPNLELRLAHPRISPDYYSLVKQDRNYLSEWLAWPLHADGEAFFSEFFKKSLNDYANNKAMVCAIFYENELVGNVSFNSISSSLSSVEIGYWLGFAHQGKGIMSKCVSYLIRYAFTELEMHKVQISAATENRPSRALCERLGMSLEGVITRAENLNGRVVDHAIYGLSREEWKNKEQM
ncbi:GNAT family N-acetyltransferase [Vibrio ishigakensis]|uniref:GNAT family N-acetyltransferase n=1 Tax=Vibrio ishigakensis TaxID=1481914 RepID=UPI0021C422E6|nr:GNAT family protein [Vibrio ishigakensis]